ncbi:MAG TPA: NAD(P)-dependent oxidoreductase [Candidatus Hydrogenedens sp.]|nr:NAD(P)-dependent oxidoreductase [Candidatus Hydrogenedens sp.]
MRIFVSGASGFVAGSILAQVPREIETFAISRQEKLRPLPEHVHWITISSGDNEEWTNAVVDLKPDAIIHTSAMADIDECEKNKDLAYKVNVNLTKALVEASEKVYSRFVFCSTDTIFDGKKGMYTETDIPIPVNYYAKTKLEAENYVLNAGISRVAARLSLVMGFPVMGVGNSFLSRMQKKIEEGKPVPMPEDEYRTPIDVITLGKALLELAQNSFEGIIHLAGNERSSRYNMGKIIAREMNWDESLIQPYVSEDTFRAPRPKDVSLDNSLAKIILKTPFYDIAGGIRVIKNFKYK